MVIFSAGDYHKKVLPASQLHIERGTSAHYTQEELISNGFLTTNVLLNVVFHTDFSMLLSVTLFGPLPLFIVMEVKVVMVIG